MEKLEAYSCFLPPLQEFSLGGSSCVSPSKPSRTAHGATVKRFPLLRVGILPPFLYSITYVTYHHINNNYSVTCPRIFLGKKNTSLNSLGHSVYLCDFLNFRGNCRGFVPLTNQVLESQESCI